MSRKESTSPSSRSRSTRQTRLPRRWRGRRPGWWRATVAPTPPLAGKTAVTWPSWTVPEAWSRAEQPPASSPSSPCGDELPRPGAHAPQDEVGVLVGRRAGHHGHALRRELAASVERAPAPAARRAPAPRPWARPRSDGGARLAAVSTDSVPRRPEGLARGAASRLSGRTADEQDGLLVHVALRPRHGAKPPAPEGPRGAALRRTRFGAAGLVPPQQEEPKSSGFVALVVGRAAAAPRAAPPASPAAR